MQVGNLKSFQAQTLVHKNNVLRTIIVVGYKFLVINSLSILSKPAVLIFGLFMLCWETGLTEIFECIQHKTDSENLHLNRLHS